MNADRNAAMDPGGAVRGSTARDRDAACGDCGSWAVAADGFCEACGLRQPSGHEHVEAELVVDGRSALGAGISDLGLRRSRNEDAFALAALPHGACGVVCDGVATAPGSEEAARAAAQTASAVLLDRIAAGADPGEATREAAEQAGRAVAALADGAPGGSGPACTFVSAVVAAGRVTVGWLGDSRAYWLSPSGSFPLTRDDSWAVRAVARGELSAEAAWADRRAHLLTAWMGADAGAFDPHLASFEPSGPGLVLICSDGLWNRLPDAAALASLALPGRGACGPEAAGGPMGAARRLLGAALDAGGHDNVTVVVIEFPPPEPTTREPGR
ncbi:PP2C family protein-serine/threonine phosphatase [Actinomadura opuntiae]|uniref:PP2C family protein-serine/threonine phosphatase n=1 Tax=Actinomadura sp. OS1-43 TaxID=604315 RepID=UPI00255AA3AB|nr:protein phosphatase 2C domain-containing protein [Actinomadura sp. OS1-43]MDL4813298.1 protein phosphatase 2C domain-containing protein [Actinomadura sp. OS1-43]